jgi:hypothetical protein
MQFRKPPRLLASVTLLFDDHLEEVLTTAGRDINTHFNRQPLSPILPLDWIVLACTSLLADADKVPGVAETFLASGIVGMIGIWSV